MLLIVLCLSILARATGFKSADVISTIMSHVDTVTGLNSLSRVSHLFYELANTELKNRYFTNGTFDFGKVLHERSKLPCSILDDLLRPITKHDETGVYFRTNNAQARKILGKPKYLSALPFLMRSLPDVDDSDLIARFIQRYGNQHSHCLKEMIEVSNRKLKPYVIWPAIRMGIDVKLIQQMIRLVAQNQTIELTEEYKRNDFVLGWLLWNKIEVDFCIQRCTAGLGLALLDLGMGEQVKSLFEGNKIDLQRDQLSEELLIRLSELTQVASDPFLLKGYPVLKLKLLLDRSYGTETIIDAFDFMEYTIRKDLYLMALKYQASDKLLEHFQMKTWLDEDDLEDMLVDMCQSDLDEDGLSRLFGWAEESNRLPKIFKKLQSSTVGDEILEVLVEALIDNGHGSYDMLQVVTYLGDRPCAIRIYRDLADCVPRSWQLKCGFVEQLMRWIYKHQNEKVIIEAVHQLILSKMKPQIAEMLADFQNFETLIFSWIYLQPYLSEGESVELARMISSTALCFTQLILHAAKNNIPLKLVQPAFDTAIGSIYIVDVIIELIDMKKQDYLDYLKNNEALRCGFHVMKVLLFERRCHNDIVFQNLWSLFDFGQSEDNHALVNLMIETEVPTHLIHHICN